MYSSHLEESSKEVAEWHIWTDVVETHTYLRTYRWSCKHYTQGPAVVKRAPAPQSFDCGRWHISVTQYSEDICTSSILQAWSELLCWGHWLMPSHSGLYFTFYSHALSLCLGCTQCNTFLPTCSKVTSPARRTSQKSTQSGPESFPDPGGSARFCAACVKYVL